MYSKADIKALTDLVVEVAEPDRVILFGSYIYGTPNEQSDIDLLVIKNGSFFSLDDEAELETQIYFKRRERAMKKIRYDIFFRSEEQARQTAERGGAFVDALSRGEIIYERDSQ